MRLVQVAKALGMTGQQLRHELAQVDFGVKPTDREIPDTLAQGILRFLARKFGKEIDASALGPSPIAASSEEAEGGVPTEASVPASPSVSAPAEAGSAIPPIPVPARPAVSTPPAKPRDIHVLRKLTLEDVPKEAVAREARILSKEEEEERAREQRAHARAPRFRKPAPATVAVQEQIKRKEGTVLLPAQISVKEFAEKTGVQIPQVIAALLKNGVMVTVTQTIDFDTAAIIAADLDVTVGREQTSARAEDLLSRNLAELLKEDDPTKLLPRPPVVVVMGHVDHGKTSLLDAIRSANVAATESGGITQHIGAYQAQKDGKAITFLDTPGHEAFTAMRARGAQITDVVVLVVAADEGVLPTTVEAIAHAREADVPILIAITKMDKPAADPDRVKGELAAQDLQPEEWGGKTPVVLCSSVTKQGIPELLDHILLLAEIAGVRANPARRAVATVIESALDAAMGPIATVIVNTGTLRIGDAFVCGRTAGKVRAMTDAQDARKTEAPPAAAVRVSGFSAVPLAGDVLQVLSSERDARNLLEQVLERADREPRRSLADLVSRIHEGRLKQLKVILKADTQGSLEAIGGALAAQTTGEVTVKVIHGAVGAVSESDVAMAEASAALVFAFRVDVPASVARTADRAGVRIREYDVIYRLLEDVDGLLKGLLEPEEHEQVIGHLLVKGVFLTEKKEQIVGGVVNDGVVKRVHFRLQRGDEMIGTGRVTSLRRVDKDIREAKTGSECGLRIESTAPVETGDTLEIFTREFKRKEV